MAEFKQKLFGYFKGITWSIVAATCIIFALGFVSAIAVRFVLVERKETHFHANFGVFINGEREKFDSFTFYEEIAACADSEDSPKGRVHMHDQISHVVHVHDKAVTWGNFFENLGYVVSDKVVVADSGTYLPGEGKQIKFILNGKEEFNIANRVIESEDTLLVSYGTARTTDISAEYAQIQQDADEYNQKPDPSACKGGADEPFEDRLKRTLGID